MRESSSSTIVSDLGSAMVGADDGGRERVREIGLGAHRDIDMDVDVDADGVALWGRVNIARNQEEVILSVVEGTRNRMPSREQSTTSDSKENMGWYFGPSSVCWSVCIMQG